MRTLWKRDGFETCCDTTLFISKVHNFAGSLLQGVWVVAGLQVQGFSRTQMED